MKPYNEMLDELYTKLPKKTDFTDRFEAPVFDSFVEGNQTLIKNFSAVAEKLRREPIHLLKFLSKELAIPGNLISKRASLQGKFRIDQLNSRLKNYIEEYVLCTECKKPDTDIIVFENHKYKRCQVCGARSPVKVI